jgi:hypothetical protein
MADPTGSPRWYGGYACVGNTQPIACGGEGTSRTCYGLVVWPGGCASGAGTQYYIMVNNQLTPVFCLNP